MPPVDENFTYEIELGRCNVLWVSVDTSLKRNGCIDRIRANPGRSSCLMNIFDVNVDALKNTSRATLGKTLCSDEANDRALCCALNNHSRTLIDFVKLTVGVDH